MKVRAIALGGLLAAGCVHWHVTPGVDPRIDATTVGVVEALRRLFGASRECNFCHAYQVCDTKTGRCVPEDGGAGDD